MEKRKWPWKRKCSESESSESLSSHSERDCDEQQEIMKESANDDSQALSLTSKATIKHDEMEESVKILTQKLSACLVNVSAKEELVKQHAKVAEEAVAGWEKAENEVAVLKQQLDVAVQHNLNLEVKTSHLDGALKECVRQLREARDEQEKRTSENSASADPDTLLILEALEKENSSLKQELVARCKELEVVTIERDLSTQAAETASKLQLEGVKKVAKLEAECRRLQSIARKSSPLNNLWSESLTESRSDSGSEPGFSDSWASISVSGLDQMKKPSTNLATCSIDIDMMDDFLEMERLAALPETKKETSSLGSAPRESISVDNQLQAELDAMIQRVANLENILENMETEKLELQNALDETMDSLQKAESRIVEAETRLDEAQKELTAASETKESLEFQLVSMEEDSKTISADVDSLKAEIEREKKLSSELTIKCQELSADVDSLKAEIEIERKLSTELTTKCQELETELTRKILETELDQSSNGELKIKQEDLAVAADKLAECQKTIASLGRQLQSLATLEDFLIDTSNIPGFSRDALDSTAGGELWRIPSNETFIPSSDLGHSRISTESLSCLGNGNGDSSRSSSLSPSSTNHGTTAKSRNSFGKFFC